MREEVHVGKRQVPKPTESELAILQVLWEHGPCVVGEVHEQLNRQRRSGYTTVLKFLQIMLEKGLVVRDERRRPFVYSASQSEGEVQRRLVDDLVERAFGGAPDRLLVQLLGGKRSSKGELAEIRRLLEERRRGQR